MLEPESYSLSISHRRSRLPDLQHQLVEIVRYRALLGGIVLRSDIADGLALAHLAECHSCYYIYLLVFCFSLDTLLQGAPDRSVETVLPLRNRVRDMEGLQLHPSDAVSRAVRDHMSAGICIPAVAMRAQVCLILFRYIRIIAPVVRTGKGSHVAGIQRIGSPEGDKALLVVKMRVVALTAVGQGRGYIIASADCRRQLQPCLIHGWSLFVFYIILRFITPGAPAGVCSVFKFVKRNGFLSCICA